MPPLPGSLFLVSMMSATMSTVNPTLLVTGGAVAHGLYARLVDPLTIVDRLLLVNRLFIVPGVLPFRFVCRSVATFDPSWSNRRPSSTAFLLPGGAGCQLAPRDRGKAIWSMVGLRRMPWLDTTHGSFFATAGQPLTTLPQQE
jgi:hypothetical protein